MLGLSLKIPDIPSQIILSGFELAADSTIGTMSYDSFTIENPPLYFNNRLRSAFIGRWDYAEAHFASQNNCRKKPLRLNLHLVKIVLRYKFGRLDGANGE